MKGLHNGFGFGTTELIVARPIEGKITSNFLYRLFSSTHFRKNAEGSMYGAGGQKRVPDDFIREFQTVLPPINEQIKITEFLAYETVKFESLIKESTSVITLLNERRSALISAAVTGQIDVRNYQCKEFA
jgi:type I restriction enzyme S subunit